jgi:hypothetical protein
MTDFMLRLSIPLISVQDFPAAIKSRSRFSSSGVQLFRGAVPPSQRYTHFFAFSPSATRRRMACARVSFLSVDDASPPVPRLSPLTQPGWFFFCFWRGRLLTAPFKPMLLGAADATGNASLAAHRRSNLL